MSVPTSQRAQPTRRWLARLALDRPELRAWAMYDWANSAFFTVVITAVFPIFFAKVVAADLSGDERRSAFGWATTASLVCAAVMGPLLGAFADFRRCKKVLFALFLALGAGATVALYTVERGDVARALWLFGLANVGAAGSFVFYDAFLPHVARSDEMDRLSTTAYAVGYLGGGLCLALCVLLIQNPVWFGLPARDSVGAAASLPARVGFVLVGVWWLVFSIPMLTRVREPARTIEADERPTDHAIRTAFVRVFETIRDLRSYKNALLMMVAFLVYNDGVGTIIRMAALYGEERHIDPSLMLVCILAVQAIGIPFTILFGVLARAIGAKRAIGVALVVYVVISWIAYRMDTAGEFVAMALLVGTVQGGLQALSRSLFASLIPKHKSAEFFGLFSTLEKFAGVLGPALFSASPSSGTAVLSMIVFFVVGGAILALVDVRKGREIARAMETETIGV